MPKVYSISVIKCCERNKVDEDCLSICHENYDERKFIGSSLCRYRYLHIHDACLRGK